MLRQSLAVWVCVALVGAAPSTATGAAQIRGVPCSSGAHTLSGPGDHVYPEMGNGGYRSLHTVVRMVYDGRSNRFLRGNHVVLTERATQCLTDFSLDFERHSADRRNGPDLRVRSVRVDGRPATWTFVQPTYPGDPMGPDDPNPLAHQAGQNAVVGNGNALPPACTPEVTGAVDAQDGTPCPANKLVITPAEPLPRNAVFRVRVAYTGRPGVHRDGDGTTEGWFRNRPHGPGGFVTTEPVGTEDWMPLNNHPSAKPTYDFHDQVSAGQVAIANGRLLSVRRHAPGKRFPHGSRTFHWRSGAPVASYLVESSVGRYHLTSHRGSDGIRYYEAQASSIGAAARRANLRVMRRQQEITDFQRRFNGPFPFRTDGVVVGAPAASFEEEMQTMITFAGGSIDLDTFHHENMHQWWGDNVSEASFSMTFFKEGLATLGEYLFHAQRAAHGRHGFQRSLVRQFRSTYAAGGRFWAVAPSDPTPAVLFSGSSTYARPGAAYLALRQILGHGRFVKALKRIQRDYGGRSITEPELETEFAHFLPRPTAACRAELGDFFTQWFDTAYAPGDKPTITGPGLAGAGFSC